MPNQATTHPIARRALGLAERAGRTRGTDVLGRSESTRPRGTKRRWLSRTALLGAVAGATIVSPLTGAYASKDPAATEGTAAEAGVVGAISAEAVEVPEASSLQADPGAELRAMTTASRSYMREASQCAVASEANGTLSAVMGGENTAPDLILPVAEGTYRLTSDYGPRSYPYPGMHEGTDFAGALGTPLYAVADGTIVYAGGGRDGRSGEIVILRAEVDGVSYDFWYGHMYTTGVLVAEGQQVTVGQQIAAIGNNGNSTGPHLHFEVHDSADQTTDPAAFLQAHGAEPVSAAAACA